MSHSQNVESEADAATRKKRKWVETLAGQFGLTGGNEAEAAERPHGSLLLAADPVGETARLQALTAYADDIAARDELMDVDAVEDGDEDESENEDDDPETDPELAVLGEAELRKVGVIRRMRIDTGNEDEDEHSDQDEEVTGDIIPNWSEAKSERRSGKRRKLEPGEAPDEIPAVSATLIHEDAPTTVGTNAKGVKNRVVTAWTMLVTQYQSKNKTTKALDVKDNPVPDQGYMQQTMAARQAYGDVTPEMSEHDMFVFPDPDPAKPEELRNLGWFRHAGPNGPHTVAFTALTSAMDSNNTIRVEMNYLPVSLTASERRALLRLNTDSNSLLISLERDRRPDEGLRCGVETTGGSASLSAGMAEKLGAYRK